MVIFHLTEEKKVEYMLMGIFFFFLSSNHLIFTELFWYFSILGSGHF